MIDSKDLMIGGFVLDRGGKTLRIDYFEKDKVCMELYIGSYFPVHPLTEYFDYLQPIPLTEQILFKCGFIYFEFSNSYQLDTIHGFSFWGRVNDGFNCYCQSEEFGTTFNFLHELQNRFYSLTKQELEINL